MNNEQINDGFHGRHFWPAVCILVCAILSICCMSSEVHAGEVRALSLEEAIALAQRDSKAWAQFDARAESAQNQVEIVKANWWPKLSVDMAVMYWSDASKLDIVDKKQVGSDVKTALGEAQQIAAKDPMLGALLASSGETIMQMAQTVSKPLLSAVPESMTLKDQFNFEFGAQLMMPLTPLIRVYYGSKLAEKAVENIEVERDAKALDISYEVTDVYLKLVYAQLMTEVAQEASDTIMKHVEMAEKYETVGMLSHSDVLSAKVEQLKAQQSVVEARNSTRLASLKLAQVLSVERGIELQASDMPRKAYELTLNDLSVYQDRALEQRSEFRRLDIGREAAEQQSQLALMKYIPNIFLMGRYQYTHGIDVLKPENQAVIGLGMQWTFFDGLANHYESKKASFEAAELSAKAEEAKELIELDVAQKYLALSTALERVKLTTQALELADENLRTITAQFAEGESVNTDVLTAQTRLTSARADDVKARIDILAAYAGLKLSMGENPAIDKDALH